MTLGELLTLLRESILNDRSDRTGGSADYLWTDQTLVTYINEAHHRFARRGLILRDATTDEATKVTLVAGQTIYPLHESVIALVSAKREEDSADITRVGHSLLSSYALRDNDIIDPAYFDAYPDGPPLAVSTDEAISDADSDSFSQVTLRVYPKPRAEDAGTVIRLRVVRTPLADFNVNALSAVPEIPRQHHLDMLDWAAYLALRIVDDDAGAPKRAQEFAESFEAHVKEARNLAMRKMFAPMGWGFGRGGFTWSS